MTNSPPWPLVGILALTVLVFFKTVNFDFVWDDHAYLVGTGFYPSATLADLLLKPINEVEYLPLRDLTYIIDYELWGWNPRGFHLSNLVLYLLNVWAVYLLARRLSAVLFGVGGTSRLGRADCPALVTAAFFAVLPLHSEVVNFIHCRNVLLSGLFFFLSCIYFLKHMETQRRLYIVLSFIHFFLALLSKATVIMLPLVLVLILYFRHPQKLKEYLKLLPFFALAAVFYFVYKFHATQSHVINEDVTIVFGSLDYLSRVAVALQIPFFYLSKLLVPIGLTTEYEIEFSRRFFSLAPIAALLSLGLVFSMSYYYRKRFPQGLFAFAWFLVCLLPVSNLFLTNPVVADRYAYLSTFAFAFFLGSLPIFSVLERWRPVRFVLPVLLLVAYAWLAFERNEVWRSELTVMTDMTKPYSNRVKGYNNLGHYYFDAGQYPQAFEYFKKARDISPSSSQLEFSKASLAFKQNRPLEALDWLEMKLNVNTLDAYAWALRGEIHESMGEYVPAAWSYQKSLDSVEKNTTTRKHATTRLENVRSKLTPILEKSREEVFSEPADLNEIAAFAVTLQEAAYREEAIAAYEELLSRGGPNWQVYFNLGLLYSDQKAFDRSLQSFLTSLSINDASSITHNEVGVLLKREGEFTRALGHFQRAIALDPASAKPRMNLARLHFQLGDEDKARQYFEHLVEHFPEYQALAQTYLSRLNP